MNIPKPNAGLAPFGRAVTRYGLIGMAALLFAVIWSLLPASTDVAHAQSIVFEGAPGGGPPPYNGPPPATVGGYSMTPFPKDGRPYFASLPGVPSPLGGAVSFAPSLDHRGIESECPGNGWNAQWGHSYPNCDIYYSSPNPPPTRLFLPANTYAFYFYAQADNFGTWNVIAGASDGTTSGPIAVNSSPAGGFPPSGQYFAFYSQVPGVTLTSIAIETDGPNQFIGVGEFGIAQFDTADLEVNKSCVGPFIPGAGFTCNFDVTNNGPGPAFGTVMTDQWNDIDPFVSDVGWDVDWGCGADMVCSRTGLMPAGTTETINAGYELPSNAHLADPDGDFLFSNEADVLAVNEPGDNWALFGPYAMTPEADLEVRNALLTPGTAPGGVALFETTYWNNGRSDLGGIGSYVLNLVGPAGLVFPIDPDWASGLTIPADQGIDATIAVQVLPSAVPGEVIQVCASASVPPGYTDPNPGNDSACATLTVGDYLPDADMDVTTTIIDAPPPLGPLRPVAGDLYTFQIEVTNHGPAQAEGVTVHDLIDYIRDVVGFGPVILNGAEIAAINEEPSWACSGNITCTRTGAMPVGAELVAQIMIRIPPDATDLLHNLSATADNPDPTPGNNIHTVLRDVDSAVNLTIEKDDIGQTIVAGGDVLLYTIVVGNDGPSDAYDVVIQDFPFPGFVLSGALVPDNSDISCVGSACTINVIPAGDSVEIYAPIRARPAAIRGEQDANQACINSASNDTVLPPLPLCSTERTPVKVSADIAVVKFGPKEANAGDQLTYHIPVINNGPSDAQSITLVETLPVGSNLVSITVVRAMRPDGTIVPFGADLLPFCQVDTPGPGQISCDISAFLGPHTGGVHRAGWRLMIELKVEADPNFCYEGKINNYVRVFADTPDPEPANNHDEWGTVIFNVANLGITKTASNAIAGEEMIFTIEVANQGPGCATGVTVIDEIRAATDNVPGLEMMSFSAVTNMPPPPPFLGDVYSCSGGAICVRGAPMPTGAVDKITLRARVPSDAISNGVNPDTGLPIDPGAPAQYENEATVIWNQDTATPGSGIAAARYNVLVNADIVVIKDDLWDPAIVGGLSDDTVVYVITLQNGGSSTARDVVVTDFLPSGLELGEFVIIDASYAPEPDGGAVCSAPGSTVISCALGNVPAGGAMELYVVARVTDILSLPNGCDGIVNNRFAYDWSDSFGGAIAGGGPDEVQSTTKLICQGDLNLKKLGPLTIGPLTPTPDTFVYMLRMTNTGPSPIPPDEATLEDNIPAGLTFLSAVEVGPDICGWDGGPPVWMNQNVIDPGAECNLEITVEVSEVVCTDLEKEIIFNEAQVHDLDGNLDQAVWLTKVDCTTELEVVKTPQFDPLTQLVAGTVVDFQIAVRNLGSTTAYDVELTDNIPFPFPTGAQIIDLYDGGPFGQCTNTGYCNLGNIAPGDTRFVTASVQIDADERGNNFQQQACAEADNAALTCDFVVGDILAEADLTIEKNDVSDFATVNALGGENTAIYIVTVQNRGPSDANDAVVSDLLPSGMHFAEEWIVNASYAGAPTTCAEPCDLGTVPAGETVELFIVTAVNDLALCDTVVTNETNVIWDDDFGGGDVAATEDTSILCSADVAIQKVGPDSVTYSDAVNNGFEYTLQINNIGVSPIAVGDLDVTELLPDKLDYQSIASQNGVCNFIDPGATPGPASLVFSNQGQLEPGEQCELVLHMTLKDEPELCADGIIFNTVQVMANDSTQDIDQSSYLTSLVCNANLLVGKIGPVAVTPGESSQFTIELTNNGPDPACGVEVQDLPINFDYVLTTLGSATSTQPGVNVLAATDRSFRRDLCMPPGTTDTVNVNLFFAPDADYPVAGDPLINCASVVAATPFASNVNGMDTCWLFSLQAVADLEVTKTALADEVGPDQLLDFHIEVVNNGPSDIIAPAASFSLTDLVEGPAEIVAISNAYCEIDPPDDPAAPYYDSATCSAIELDKGDKLNLLLTVRVDEFALPFDIITNTVTIVDINGFEDPNPNNNQDDAAVVVTADEQADLSLRKYVKPDGQVDTGDEFIYTLFIDNMGPSNATFVFLEDTLFSDGQFEVLAISTDRDGAGAACGSIPAAPTGPVNPLTIFCTLDGLEIFGRWTINVTAIAFDEMSVNNDARVWALNPQDPDQSNNSDSASISVGGSADVSVEKAAVTTAVNAGETASWNVTVNNGGPSQATNVVIRDNLPAAIVADTVTIMPDTYGCTVGTPGDPHDPTICNLGNMGAAAPPIVLTISGQVAPDYRGSPEIVNDVSADSDTADPDSSNNRDTANVAISTLAGLRITKESQPAVVKAGEMVDYAITVANDGPSIAANVAMADALPTEMTYNSAAVVGGSGSECSYAPGSRTVSCLLGDLAVNGNTQILINATIKPDTPPGDILNTATVTSDSGATKMDDAVTTITVESGLSATKRASSLSPATGEIYSYAVEVTNHGPSVAENVLVEDELTGSVRFLFSRGAECIKVASNDDEIECNLGTLAPGQTVAFDIVVQVKDWVWEGHNSDNMIKVTSTTPGSNGQPAMTLAYSEEIVFRNINDLHIRKFGKPDGAVDAGNKLTYTIIVDNFGPGYAYNPHVRDFLASDGTYTFTAPDFCTLSSGTVTGNQELDCALETIEPGKQAIFTVEVTASEPQTVNNTAEVSADGTDLDQNNNYAIVEHEIDAVADLQVSKTVDSSMVDAGDVVHYTITVHNDGPSTANNVVVLDTLPGGVSVVTIEPDQGSCTTGPVKCNLGNLGSGQTTQVVLQAEVSADITPETVLLNNVVVLSNAFDDDMGDNLASVGVTVKANHVLHVEKSASTNSDVSAGDEVDFRILVRNTGKSTIHDVVIQDDLPSDLHFVSYSIVGNAGSCVDTLFSPEVVCDVGTIAPNEERTIYIRAQVDPGAQSGTLVNLVTPDSRFDASSDLSGAVNVVNSAHIRLETEALVTAVRPGDIFAYLVRVINGGPSMAKHVTVNVDLPEHLSYVSDTIGCGETLQGCLVGDMEPNTQREFQVLVQIDEAALNVTQVVVTASAATTTTNATFDTSQAAAMVIVNGNAGHIFMPMINR